MLEKEYINRSEVLTELEKVPHLKLAGSIIKSIKASDVVEVVRCKDCIEYNGHRYCNYHADPVDDLDYCSCGKRGSIL